MRTFKIRKKRTDDLMEDFVRAERMRSTWAENIFLYDIGIASTASLAGEVVVPPEEQEIVIRPGIFNKVMGVFLLVLGGYLWWICISAGRLGMVSERIAVLGVLGASAGILAVTAYFFLSRRYNYSLRISAAGLWYRGGFVGWRELAETAVMRRSGRKLRRLYLVLFRKDGTAEKLRLSMFDISVEWLAMKMEQYKAIGA